MGEYTRGIAFVLEGATEKVFYRAFLKWFAEQNNCSFVKGDNLDNGDIYFEWDNGAETILIILTCVMVLFIMVYDVSLRNNYGYMIWAFVGIVCAVSVKENNISKKIFHEQAYTYHHEEK